MTAALCESKSYFHPVIWSIITQRLFALSWNLKDIVLLWLFIVPASLIPNTTSSVCTCYIFAGNSSERQRQTWIVEMTRSQSLLCKGCEAYRKQRCQMQAQLQVITPAVERTNQSTAKMMKKKKSHHQQHAVPVTPTCIWKYDKTYQWQAFIYCHTLLFFKFSKYRRLFSSCFQWGKIISLNLNF